MAAGSDVAGAEVAHHGQSRALGDDGGLAELQGAARLATLDPVEHGLPVRGDQRRPATRELRVAPGGGVREHLSREHVELA